MDMAIDDLRHWLGRKETLTDRIAPGPVNALAATLDRADPPARPGDPLPPLWHWLYFLQAAPRSQLGPDGHPRRGGFLPPVALPRRMWAGGRLWFHRPLRIGTDLSRVSRVVDISHKRGRSGDLVFVTVRHEIADDEGLALTEEHDIAYRDIAAPGSAAPPATPAPDGHVWIREVVPDPVLLFRYSALTFNGHRIHYDRRYATGLEGYPGLVVHGPLIATLLLDLVRDQLPRAHIAGFEFRARRPLFDTAPFFVCGRPEPDGRVLRLWAKAPDGTLAMEADATLG